MSTVDLNAKIPNNVDLAQDKRLQRALEQWQPNYLDWWKEMGPEGLPGRRTSGSAPRSSVDAEGWAHFDYVKMPDYRWGIFLADAEPDRKIGFGDNLGQPAWQRGARASTGTRCAGSSSPRATRSPRASSSSACSATPRPASTTSGTSSR